MNDELKKRLNDAGVELLEWARQGGAFVMEQAPLVAQEVLAWELWAGVLMAVFGSLLLLACLLLTRKAFASARAGAGRPSYDRPDPFPWIMAGIVSGIPGIALFVCGAVTAVKVLVAPRVVLIEKLGELIR